MANFQVSPGVEIKEIDLTNVIPAVSVSIGGIAGSFSWGPVEEITQVGSERELVEKFGQPDEDTFKYFMPAAQFLKYSSDLRVIRTNNDGQLNATPDGDGMLIKNETDHGLKTFVSGQEFIAKYPGPRGDSISVYVATNEDAFESVDFTTPGYDKLFSFAPTTTEYAASR